MNSPADAREEPRPVSVAEESGATMRVILSWSSGKDAAWTLHVLRQMRNVEVVALMTTVATAFERVAMHGVRVELLHLQAEAAGLPLIEVPLPWPCSNDDYERAMLGALLIAKEEHRASHMAFGDLFLEDVRRYRELQLEPTGLRPLFPLWGLPTASLAREMLDGGLRARIVCLNPETTPRDLIGQELGVELPAGIDPCGENGEFHTFAYAGPMFRHPIGCNLGEIVERSGFVYQDLVPGPMTPCKKVCKLGSDNRCVECHRTLDEIAAWGTMTDAERLEVMDRLGRSPS